MTLFPPDSFPTDSTATRNWVFRDGQQVSSILYQVRNWKGIESPHFRFLVSDTTMFHPANIDALEKFLSGTAAWLGMSQADLDLLAREKIIYCFCSNQDEIRELTGFFARGMFILSHDIIVSTFSAHFHELAHLLINFKLKQPHLYTHPFFLEGFAVAVGGRGGKAPDILHQLGLSNLREGWVTIDELKDARSFYQVNASMSYPASGVYNRFLLEKPGAAEYLELYSKYGGGAEAVMTMGLDEGDLPAEESWKQYLKNQPTEGDIRPGPPGHEAAQGPIFFRFPEKNFSVLPCRKPRWFLMVRPPRDIAVFCTRIFSRIGPTTDSGISSGRLRVRPPSMICLPTPWSRCTLLVSPTTWRRFLRRTDCICSGWPGLCFPGHR